jgi:predicted transcriptional regulator
MDEIETVEFLARSETRLTILQELAESDHLTRAEFRQRLEASRTTVQRNLEALVDQGLISQDGRHYSLTAGSGHVLDRFLDLLETVKHVEYLQPFLEWVDTDELDFEVSLLGEAEIFTPRAGDPYAMINRHVDRLDEGREIRALLPFTGLHATEVARERVLHHGAQGELVVVPTIVTTYRTQPEYRELFEDLAGLDRFDLYEYDGRLPFSISLVDETVQLIAAEGNEPRAMLESDDPDLRRRAESIFEEYKRQATPVDLFAKDGAGQPG